MCRPSQLEKLENKIFSVHLSDNDGVTEWHWPPGQGNIDWESVFEALHVVGYEGILSLDVSGIDIEREVKEGKNYIERILKKIPIVSSLDSEWKRLKSSFEFRHIVEHS